MEYFIAFNFKIYYCKELTNSANSPSHQPDYELKGADNNELLLPILQQKLQSITAPKRPKTIAVVQI